MRPRTLEPFNFEKERYEPRTMVCRRLHTILRRTPRTAFRYRQRHRLRQAVTGRPYEP
ncbi:hypothetical protein ACQ86N_24490 [Puia sp. P3]|uniref:hypothetical protein n=1 Tax=Puia sp. P3 TaxID=3423952 RepID=UPI003D67B6B5